METDKELILRLSSEINCKNLGWDDWTWKRILLRLTIEGLEEKEQESLDYESKVIYQMMKKCSP